MTNRDGHESLEGRWDILYRDYPEVYEEFGRIPKVPDFIDVMAARYVERSRELEDRDMARERDHNWFLSQEIVGMALYADGFAGDLEGVRSHAGYLQELGINMLHVMPILKCPKEASDGGYAVSDFRRVDGAVGQDLRLLGVHRLDTVGHGVGRARAIHPGREARNGASRLLR